MSQTSWTDIILNDSKPSNTWTNIFDKLSKVAQETTSSIKLHETTVAPDRLLAEAAWELWSNYTDSVERTSDALKLWCSNYASSGRAVLLLDALSLRELHLVLGGAEKHGVQVAQIKVTGSEMPSDTDSFSQSIGLSQRSQLANNGKPAGFKLFETDVYTDVLQYPFVDCVPRIPNASNLFVWHTWLDDLIHVHKRLPDQIAATATEELQSDGFWKLVNRLRQGRQLVITSDHGYAVSKLFSSEEMDTQVVEALKEAFGGSRYKTAKGDWKRRFMPPLVHTENKHHVVMGQHKWKVQGGFPHLCHGGMSLLEVAVPFIEFPAL